LGIAAISRGNHSIAGLLVVQQLSAYFKITHGSCKYLFNDLKWFRHLTNDIKLARHLNNDIKLVIG
jgi:hypothetical protein